jgi:hypothetical protein
MSDEQKMIEAKAPGISEKVAAYLAEVADMARKSHADGVLKAPLSPRETIACARRARAFSGNTTGDAAMQAQCAAMAASLEMTFLFRWAPEERQEFMRAATSVAKRMGLPIVLE